MQLKLVVRGGHCGELPLPSQAKGLEGLFRLDFSSTKQTEEGASVEVTQQILKIEHSTKNISC